MNDHVRPGGIGWRSRDTQWFSLDWAGAVTSEFVRRCLEKSERSIQGVDVRSDGPTITAVELVVR